MRRGVGDCGLPHPAATLVLLVVLGGAGDVAAQRPDNPQQLQQRELNDAVVRATSAKMIQKSRISQQRFRGTVQLSSQFP
jgi:hypothetical protein